VVCALRRRQRQASKPGARSLRMTCARPDIGWLRRSTGAASVSLWRKPRARLRAAPEPLELAQTARAVREHHQLRGNV
jgi:hypothetical protein